jgi:hypothetical protein
LKDRSRCHRNLPSAASALLQHLRCQSRFPLSSVPTRMAKQERADRHDAGSSKDRKMFLWPTIQKRPTRKHQQRSRKSIRGPHNRPRNRHVFRLTGELRGGVNLRIYLAPEVGREPTPLRLTEES